MNINLKQQEVSEYTIGEYTFYVKPFSAMKSVNISADLTKTIGPAVGGIFSLLGSVAGEDNPGGDVESVLSRIDPQKAVTVLREALTTLDGDDLERVVRRLLIDYHNVSVSGPMTEDKAVPMDMNIFNDVFCCETQNIYLLCWDVINLNFGSFFGDMKLRFGDLTGVMGNQIMSDTASST